MNCSPIWKSQVRCSHNCLSGLVQRFTLNDRHDVLELKSFITELVFEEKANFIFSDSKMCLGEKSEKFSPS